MSGGQAITSGVGTLDASDLVEVPLGGSSSTAGQGSVAYAANNVTTAATGSESTAAIGDAVSAMLVRLRSRKVGGGSATAVLLGGSGTFSSGVTGTTSGPQTVGVLLSAAQGALAKTRSRALNGAQTSSQSGSLVAQGAASIQSASIDSLGTSLSLVFSQTVQIGSGGASGVTLGMSGGATTLTFVSASGNTLTYTSSRTINSGETGTVAYVQPGNGIESLSGSDVANFSGVTVTNNSIQGGFPVPISSSIDATGLTLTLNFSEPVSVGVDTSTPVASMTNGAVTLTYQSGSDTATRIYTTSRTVQFGETGTLSYTQPGDGYRAIADGDLVQSFSGFAITNNSVAGVPSPVSSTVPPNGTTLSIVFSTSVSIGTGGAGGFVITASGGATNPSFSSGSGSTTLVFNLDRTIGAGESITVSYTQPGNGVEGAGGVDAPSFTNLSVQNQSTAGPPTVSSVAITSATVIRLIFSKAVTFGAGGNGGFSLSMTGGAVTMTYASGSGSTTLLYNLSRSIGGSETGTIAYTQPGNGVEATTGEDLVSFSGTAVQNNVGGGFLSWTATPNATGYKVYWSRYSWGYLDAALVAAGVDAGVVDVGNVTSIASLPGIGTGTRYFNIRAYDISGLEGVWIADTELQKTI